jgi:hypothetical protein
VAKKSRKAKRDAPARKKKGMKKATLAKKKKKPAPKPAPAPVASSPSVARARNVRRGSIQVADPA